MRSPNALQKTTYTCHTLRFCCSLSGAILRPGRVVGVVDGGVLLTSNTKIVKTSSCVLACEISKCFPLLCCILQGREPSGSEISACCVSCLTSAAECHGGCKKNDNDKLQSYLGPLELALQLLHGARAFAQFIDSIGARKCWLSLQW